MKTLKDLGLSLLNATLMLAIILVVLTLMLVSRMSTLVESVGEAARTALTAPSARIEQVAATLTDIRSNPELAQIDGARIDALTAEVQALNAQLSDMRENISQIPLQQITQKVREEFGRALAARAPAPPSD
jgi:hypothetical protein